MKINDAIKNKASMGLEKALTEKNAQAKPSETKAENASNAKKGENVTLSAMSVQLQSLTSDVSASGVYDAEKVEAIKSAIASGQFKVNSEKVADGLIDTVKNLIKDQ